MPARAGLEAGGVPEPTGLGAGLGRVRGQLTPKIAQISQSSSIFACFDFLDFRALCIIKNTIEQPLCDPGETQNMMKTPLKIEIRNKKY